MVFFTNTLSLAQSDPKTLAKVYIINNTQDVKSISVEALRDRINAKTNDFVLLDVRTYDERKKGRTILTRGEIHIPRGMLEIKAWGKIPKNKAVIVYCAKGSRGRLAAKTLADMGWHDITNLSGGIEAYYAMLNRDCGCDPQSLIDTPKM